MVAVHAVPHVGFGDQDPARFHRMPFARASLGKYFSVSFPLSIKNVTAGGGRHAVEIKRRFGEESNIPMFILALCDLGTV